MRDSLSGVKLIDAPLRFAAARAAATAAALRPCSMGGSKGLLVPKAAQCQLACREIWRVGRVTAAQPV